MFVYFEANNLSVGQVENFLCKTFSFNACSKTFIYIKKRSDSKIDLCGTSRFFSPAS